MQKKIYSFQSLRAIAILAIFLGHLVYFEKIKNLSTLFEASGMIVGTHAA